MYARADGVDGFRFRRDSTKGLLLCNTKLEPTTMEITTVG